MSDLSNTPARAGGDIALLPDPGHEQEAQATGQSQPEPGIPRRANFDEIFGNLGGFGGFGGSEQPPQSETATTPPLESITPANHRQVERETEAFPVDALPPVMRRIVMGTAEETMLPIPLAATAALATLSASIGSGLQVKVGRYQTAANLYVLIGMRSGMGKDDIDRYIVAPLTEGDRRLRQRWTDVVDVELREDLDDEKDRYAYHRKVRDRLVELEEREVESARMRDSKARIVEIERRLKRCPKLATTAPGKVQLGLDMMNQAGEAYAILTPEGRDSVFRVGDEAFYCAAFSGTRVEDARRTRANMRLEHPCLTVMLLAQPDFIVRQLEREKMVESGLLPRFLIYACTPELRAVPVDPPFMAVEVAEEWEYLVWCTVSKFRLRETGPVVIEADQDAVLLFLEYENENRAKRCDGGDLADIQSFAARWTEQATKIAVVLHVGLHGQAAGHHPLSAETAGNAIRIGRWFANRQLEVLFVQRDAWLRSKAEKLRGKLLKMKTNTATLGELAKAGWTNDEVRRLAGCCPDLIGVECKPAGKRGGRPTEIVKAA